MKLKNRDPRFVYNKKGEKIGVKGTKNFHLLDDLDKQEKPKTLKDIFCMNHCNELWVNEEELKKEAIKRLKYRIKYKTEYKMVEDWVEFFNITEDELK